VTHPVGSAGLERVSQPRETIRIRLGSLATCEAVAELYSYIAYPDPLDAKRREQFSIAMARWAVLERGQLEKSWNESADMKPSIRPLVFSQLEQDFLKIYSRGSKILYRRLVLAFMMLCPHLLEDEINGLSPTISNVVLAAARKLNYSDESQKTVEARIWAPVKPVIHAAAAAMYCLSKLEDTSGSTVNLLEVGPWDDGQHPLCHRNPMLATLFYEDVIKELLLPMAEQFRVQLPSCSRFQISDEDTIRFVAD